MSAMRPAPDRPPDRRPDDPAARLTATAWLRRLGWAGFLFFLVKGLLWLAVPALLVATGVDCNSPP